MSGNQMEVFEQVADMIIEEDFMGGPKSPAFIKLLSLQFSRAEAKLALQIRTTGATLDQLVQKTGMKKEKLKKTLHTMADKGTVYYDSGDDPTYQVVKMAAPGLTETGLWGGIKYPFTIELAKTNYQLLKDWTEEKLCKLGFPFAPVWAAVNTLPEDADPSQNLVEAIRNEGHWSASPCPCRLSHWIADPGNHCDHILETCIHTGDQSRWAVKHRLARELTFDQLVELLKQCNENGLVHSLNIQNCICNCCNDCCAIFAAHNSGHKAFIPSSFVPELDDESCDTCSRCAERCPVHAIEVDEANGSVFMDHDDCIGCGVCVTACKQDAISLTQRPAAA
jgi:Pyruvate/2-oxoacid:ferredoxin oxidoreductase delta subunit